MAQVATAPHQVSVASDTHRQRPSGSSRSALKPSTQDRTGNNGDKAKVETDERAEILRHIFFCCNS